LKRDPLLLLILSSIGLPACGERADGAACLTVAPGTTECPAAKDVDTDALYVPNSCDGERIVSVEGAGTLVESWYGIYDTASTPDLSCCYEAILVDPKPGQECVIGRPYREGADAEVAVIADAVRRDDWTGGRSGGPMRGTDAPRARAWGEAGLFEHASVASFARVSLELAAHGAPADLLRATHAAAMDEIDHAERCFAQARRFGADPVGPGCVPFAAPIVPGRELALIAADTVRDGCLGETVGALLAREAARRAEDPAVRESLLAIAADEERHAALSWRIVAWALRKGGHEVREAVVAAFSTPPAPADIGELALRAGVDVEPLRAVARAAGATVVGPAAEAMLAA
jgi:hypothetical protein